MLTNHNEKLGESDEMWTLSRAGITLFTPSLLRWPMTHRAVGEVWEEFMVVRSITLKNNCLIFLNMWENNSKDLAENFQSHFLYSANSSCENHHWVYAKFNSWKKQPNCFHLNRLIQQFILGLNTDDGHQSIISEIDLSLIGSVTNTTRVLKLARHRQPLHSPYVRHL